MSEEERLAIAKALIECILKSYNVFIYDAHKQEVDELYIQCIESKKRIEFDNV